MTATAVGEIEAEGKVLILRRVEVTYHLQVGADADRDTIERVHGFHAERCPVYRSIHPQIQVTTRLEVVDA